MSGVAVRLLRLLAIPVGLVVGFVWLFLVAVPGFVLFGGEVAMREIARGYWLVDWGFGTDAFRL